MYFVIYSIQKKVITCPKSGYFGHHFVGKRGMAYGPQKVNKRQENTEKYHH
jgi:hypothetical protein